MAPFLGQRRVINHQVSRLAADQAVGLGKKGLSKRPRISDTSRNELVQTVLADPLGSGRYRLHAPVVAGGDATEILEAAEGVLDQVAPSVASRS